MNNSFDPASDARFRAVTELEIRYLREQINLLREHMSKRRAEIDAISNRINGTILSAAGILGAVLFGVVKSKLGL
jgi:hypothetical protein